MDLGRYRLIVFDCDGTLVDSQATILTVMQETCALLDITPPADDIMRRTVGLTLEIAMAHIWPEKSGAWHNEIANAYRARFREHRLHEKVSESLFEGIQDLLVSLRAPHLFLGIATGKEMRGLEITLNRHGLRQHFHTFQTADKCPSKPHPAMLLKAMEELGCRAEETVMIGDTSFDMLMAQAAKVTSVGVSWGYHSVEDLNQAGATAILDSANELPGLLLKLQ
jgi:phosphoglycolate phosphatase